jgi:hypothetical protein
LIYKAQEDVSKLLKASAPAVEILENWLASTINYCIDFLGINLLGA